jgi:hypothetical protein
MLTSILLRFFGERLAADSSIAGQLRNPVPAVAHTEHTKVKPFNVWVRYHRIYNGLWTPKINN